MSEEEKLLPCPFCGREPGHMSRAASPNTDSPTGQFHAISCFCGGNSARAYQWGWSFEEAQEKWNTRKEQNQ